MRRTFNLAAWAINHRPFLMFIMILLLAAGGWSYSRLGRSEDPPGTVKNIGPMARRLAYAPHAAPRLRHAIEATRQ
jgi:hypothetical protein